MRALILLALLIPLTAEAGMLGGGKGMLRARTSPVAARYVPRVGQAFVGERGEPVTVTRASAKSCLAGGIWISVAANRPCIGDAGLSVEGSRTQYALNNCTAPADQTVTLSAGVHSLWLEGAGTVAAAVGTAVATGLPCTATAAAACSFTVSAGGTVTLDVTGTVTAMQVENGARSSLICATTTPVTRAADVVSAAHGIADPNRWTISMDLILQPYPGTAYELFAIGSYGVAGSFRVIDTGTYMNAYFWDSAGSYLSSTMDLGYAPGGRNQLSLSNDHGVISWQLNGSRSSTVGVLPMGAAFSAAEIKLGPAAYRTVTTCNTSSAGDCQ